MPHQFNAFEYIDPSSWQYGDIEELSRIVEMFERYATLVPIDSWDEPLRNHIEALLLDLAVKVAQLAKDDMSYTNPVVALQLKLHKLLDKIAAAKKPSFEGFKFSDFDDFRFFYSYAEAFPTSAPKTSPTKPAPLPSGKAKSFSTLSERMQRWASDHKLSKQLQMVSEGEESKACEGFYSLKPDAVAGLTADQAQSCLLYLANASEEAPSDTTIKKSHRQLLLLCHPDKAKTTAQVPVANEYFKLIQALHKSATTVEHYTAGYGCR